MSNSGKTYGQVDLQGETILNLKNYFFDFLLDVLDDLRLLREFLQDDKKDLMDYQLVLTVQKIFDFLSLF